MPSNKLDSSDDTINKFSQRLHEIVDAKLTTKQQLTEAVIERAKTAIIEFKNSSTDNKILRLTSNTEHAESVTTETLSDPESIV